jgi:signal transduction histidine kinase/CHASE3 domain sensor protein/phage shock protein A
VTRSLTVRIAVPVAAVGAVLIAALLIVNTAISQYRESARTAVRTERLIAQANATKNLLLDAETGVRGFALTGEDRFLAPWQQAAREFDAAAQALIDGAGGSARPMAERVLRDGRAYLDDYARPLVLDLQADPDGPARARAITEGKRRVDALRAEFAQFASRLQAESATSTSTARRNGDRAKWITIGAIAAIVVLLGALVVYLARSVTRPIRRTADAAHELGQGRLDVRVPTTRGDEIGELGRAFNAMATSLEESAAELESQNAELENQNQELESQAVELEAQTAELENVQQELSERNEELLAQQGALEQSAASLRDANARISVYAEVADRLGRFPELSARAQTALSAVADLLGAEVGTLYAAVDGDDRPLSLLAARGVAAESVGERLPAGQDLPGRALRERRTVAAAHPDGALRLRAFGRDVEIRQELHIPLLHGDRALGVLSVGRAADAPLQPAEVEAGEYLAELAAVALDNALVTLRARELADINRAVLDATRDGIRLVDLDGRTILVNPAMERMAAEALADHTDFATTPADHDSGVADEFEVAPTGRWFHRYVAPVRRPDGELVGRIFVVRETTEEHDADRFKDELMATVSHELRTPLAAILGFTELLLTRDFSTDERRQHTQTVHAQAQRLSDLIGDFLDLQRLDQHAGRLSQEQVDLSTVLREQVALYAAQSDAHPIALRLPEAPLLTRGDARSLARVVGNLLSNAIKYSPDGGAVTVDAARHADTISVSVTDAGIGIPAEARERIFDRFYRVDSSETRSIGGTGLGLSLVREIVREHGGSVTVDSLDGHGSTFSVTLPIASPVPSPSAAD